MLRTGKVIIVAMLLLSLIVSGCADRTSTEEEVTTEAESDTGQNLSDADEMLNEEMVGITDTEMEDLEADLAELEALINEMDLEEDIVIEEI